MKILLKYPTRRRSALFMDRVRNWSSLSSGRHELHWLVSVHADDATMQTEEIARFCDDYQIELFTSNAQNKVQNYSAGVDQTAFDWDFVCVVSDDMRVLKQDWDCIVAREFGDNLDQALWFPDGLNPTVNTISIMGRPVYERIGAIYDNRFESVYCDNYYVWLCERAGVMRKVDMPGLFLHEWKVRNNDALMRETENPAVYARDRDTFRRLTMGAA